MLSPERASERKGTSTVEQFIWVNLYSLDLNYLVTIDRSDIMVYIRLLKPSQNKKCLSNVCRDAWFFNLFCSRQLIRMQKKDLKNEHPIQI